MLSLNAFVQYSLRYRLVRRVWYCWITVRQLAVASTGIHDTISKDLSNVCGRKNNAHHCIPYYEFIEKLIVDKC
uniref:Uncharacterized protein n=1 Tax=Physcomitrium patens TaxID=3218 RepID=A0A2K1IA91_PHYPA|nr:hypothetical protein PHYPA_030764 [Physcomitrium patens]